MGAARLSADEIVALIAAAAQVRRCAHAPYSGYAVGAAVVTDDDRVFVGCNVENASYGLTLCAERAALAAAVAAGGRAIRAAVVVTEGDEPQAPCGACRQWLAEFGAADTEVIVAGSGGAYRRHSLGELLPAPFGMAGAGRTSGGRAPAAKADTAREGGEAHR